MNVIFLLINLQIPVIMLIMGLLLWKKVPEYRSAFGYHSGWANKSPLTWAYAQVTFGRLMTFSMIPVTVLTVIAGLVGIIRNFDEDTAALVLLAVESVQIIVIFVIIFIVEHGMKKYFNADGTPKA